MATESDEASPGPAAGQPPGAGTDDPPETREDDTTPIGEPPPRPSDPARRALLLAPIIAILVGVVVVFATLPDGTPLPSTSGVGSISPGSDAPSGTTPSGSAGSASAGSASAGSETVGGITDGYLVTVDELRQKSERAAAGEEPYKTAVDDLMAWADRAIDDRSRPEEPIYIKGTDDPFVTDARRAYGLGLAYVVSQDERFAVAARKTIRAWMDVATSTRDTCPDRGACQTSLIIGRAGAGFPMGAYLIAGSDAWTNADRVDLQAWMHDVVMPAASERPNNWGDAGAFLRIVAADYSGDQGEFDRAIETWRSFIDLIEADGRIPEEVRRGSAGISYTQEALQYKVAVARIAERHGIDLWDYQGALGGSLHKALDRLAYYWTRPGEWPDFRNPLVPSPGPVWEIAYAHWQEPAWLDIVRASRPYGDEGHSAIRWTTLTNGIPFDPQVAAEPSGGAPSPGPSASPSATVTDPPAAIAGLALHLAAPLAGSVRVGITWQQPSDATAVVELERSTGGGTWSPLRIGSDGSSATDSLKAGAVHAYRARATVGGVAGPWTSLTDVAVARLEGSNRKVQRKGAWTQVPFADYSAGSALSTNSKGARLTWRGSVQSLAVVGPTGPTRGRMIVTVDGKRAKVVDLQTSAFQPRVALFTKAWSRAGVHEIVVESLPRSGHATVAVDDIVTLTSTLREGS